MFKFKKKKSSTNEDKASSSNHNFKALNEPVPEDDQFFISMDLEETMPSDEKVNALFNNLLDDLDIVGPKRSPLQSLSIRSKWDFLKKQQERDKNMRSPKWAIRQLQENITVDVLESINLLIANGRISWCKQFCQNNGHIELLIVLVSTQARIDFKIMRENDIKLISLALSSIQAICDTMPTLNCVTSQCKALPVIINSINPDKIIITKIIEILLLFLFEYEENDVRLKISKDILKCFHDLDRDGQNGWDIITSFLINDECRCQISRHLSAFLKTLLLIFNKNGSVFLEWYQEMSKVGLFEAMKSEKLNSRFDSVLEYIEGQRKMLINGISTSLKSSLSIEQSQSQKSQLESIMGQLKDDDILATEDPFFDLSKFQIKSMLGSGSFGDVYKVKSRTTDEIYAVKVSKLKVKEETNFSNETLSIFREISLMSSFNYPTILKFIGYSPTDFDGRFHPTIVMEFCRNETLRDVIDKESNGMAPALWDETKKLINAYGIASGMKYLHQQKVIHRDLKTQNILMDDMLCPKIADFGLSKMIAVSEQSPSMNMQSASGFKGTQMYAAPEILNGEPYSMEGDVYSFAFIVYEIVTGERPFEGFNPCKFYQMVANGGRPELPDDVPENYKNLIERCWSQSPSDRPTFDEIVNELKSDRSFITDCVDEAVFYDFIDFLDSYQSSFDLNKKAVTYKEFLDGKRKKKVVET